MGSIGHRTISCDVVVRGLSLSQSQIIVDMAGVMEDSAYLPWTSGVGVRLGQHLLLDGGWWELREAGLVYCI